VIGGTVLVIQTFLNLLGLAGDGFETDVADGLGDADPDVAHDALKDIFFLKMLSLRTLVAFLTFFGLAGLWAGKQGYGEGAVLLIATGAGVAAFVLVGYLMESMMDLEEKGNLDLTNAIGATGSVYQAIPANRTRIGKVTLEIQGQRIQCKAVTDGEEIPMGKTVGILELTTPDTFLVELKERNL
jgi:hypothetical protein